MLNINVFFGVGFLAIGCISLSSYFNDLASFRISLFYKELRPMQERWGKDVGTALHIVGYVVAPIGFGIAFLTGLILH